MTRVEVVMAVCITLVVVALYTGIGVAVRNIIQYESECTSNGGTPIRVSNGDQHCVLLTEVPLNEEH